jgi:hypothetical protein
VAESKKQKNNHPAPYQIGQHECNEKQNAGSGKSPKNTSAESDSQNEGMAFQLAIADCSITAARLPAICAMLYGTHMM